MGFNKIKKGRVITTRPFTNQQIQIDYYLNLDNKNKEIELIFPNKISFFLQKIIYII